MNYEMEMRHSEVGRRYWSAILDLEDKWLWVRQTKYRYIQSRIAKAKKAGMHPICHAGYVWEKKI